MSDQRPPSVQGARLNPEDRAADDWAEAAVRDRLPRLRATAAAWQQTVGTVAGLLGIGTLFNADAVVDKMSEPEKAWFAVLAIAAFLAASGSIALASLASQYRSVEIPPDVTARRGLEDAAFKYTRLRLMWSRQLAGVAMLALLGSFLFRWFA